MHVLALWRYPVKAMLGEAVDALEIGPGGPVGDRGWIVVDAESGERIANKSGPTDPRLRASRAELLEGDDGPVPLRVTLPDGSVHTGADIDDALSALLEKPVRVERSSAPAQARYGATGADHDLAPLHLITTSTLARLAAVDPGVVADARRFRPNVLLDDGAETSRWVEDDLIGATLTAPSGLALEVSLPCPRCVVPTRAHEEIPAAPQLLRTLVAEHGFELPAFGRHGCAGSYAEVAAPGELRLGDTVTVQAGDAPAATVIAAAVERIQAVTS